MGIKNATNYGISKCLWIQDITIYKARIMRSLKLWKMKRTREKKVTNEELKALQLEILKDIHNFCIEHDITYYLGGGTLLGAIRHKGFIPWDDDIDIFMLRPDYERFIKLYKPDKYDVFYPGKKGYFLTETKVANKDTVLKQYYPMAAYPIGTHVDVIPYDGLPKDINKFVEFINKFIDYRTTLLIKRYIYQHKFLGIKSVIFHPFYFFYKNKSFKRNWYKQIEDIVVEIDKLAQQYDVMTSDYIGFVSMSPNKYRERFPRSIIDGKPIRVSFEGFQFYAPSGFDEKLKILYDNYIQLPPIEKRKSEHIWEAYWK